jgi:ATP-dependent Lon protease
MKVLRKPLGVLAKSRRSGVTMSVEANEPEQEPIENEPVEASSEAFENGPIETAILSLRDVVVFPHMVIPLFVGREKSIKALEHAIEGSRQILLIAQKEATQDNPEEKDIYTVGTLSNILQMLKLPDGTIKVLVEGVERGRVVELLQENPFFLGKVEQVKTHIPEEIEIEGLLRSVLSQFDNYVRLDKKLSVEILVSLAGIDDPLRFIDTVVAHMPLKIAEKQKILEIEGFKERVDQLMQLIEIEIDQLQVEKRISGNVKKQIEKKQREYYLTEKIQAIQKELGELDEEGGKPSEIVALLDKIEKARMPKEVKDKVMVELGKLKMMSPMSAEATVFRNYIDWVLAVPWKKRSKIRANLAEAEAILNKEHYGLEKVKERILEYLAVQQRVQKMGGPILCLVGPPGVGKTSLGESIARATSRQFVRMSLGGVRDEAEIRGHRRTYVGALPGKVLQKMAKVGVKNPLFLLDEIDKMSTDFRGDPASALLEVLDPEQNKTFNDHYLEVDYDLSDVMFITTANSMNIPSPLLDRMEVIRLSGYTEDEKLNIAMRYLIPKKMLENGLKPEELTIEESAIIDIVRYYTREAGVRSLEREISKICRKKVKELLLGTHRAKVVDCNTLEHYLGVRKYRFGQAEEHDQIGQVTGLAWTEVGGEMLTIEAVATPGKGKVTTTGKLGEVMQESIQAAMTVVRSRAKSLGISDKFYEEQDIHVHVPEGATPKDGPSAGIGMCCALVSILTNIPIRKDVAMTGEITLRGQVLPIGGLKEKLLAARRGGILNVIIPEENQRELSEIPEVVYQGMNIHPVKWIDEVFELALAQTPSPLNDEKGSATAIKAQAVENKNESQLDDPSARHH